MACKTCGNEHQDVGKGYYYPEANFAYPFNANDIQMVDNGETRRFTPDDWNPERHKLILFIPDITTPICATEFAELSKWVSDFNEIGCDVFGASTDPIGLIKDTVDNENLLQAENFKMLSTYLLPSRLKIMNGGKAKRASVFVTHDNEVVVQEHFMTVGRSIQELYRTLEGYASGEYCAALKKGSNETETVVRDDSDQA